MGTARYSRGRLPSQLTGRVCGHCSVLAGPTSATAHRAGLWTLLGTRGADFRHSSQGGSVGTARYSRGRRPPQLTGRVCGHCSVLAGPAPGVSHRAGLWAQLGTRGAGGRRQSQGGSVGTAGYSRGRRPASVTGRVCGHCSVRAGPASATAHRAGLWTLLGTRGAEAVPSDPPCELWRTPAPRVPSSVHSPAL